MIENISEELNLFLEDMDDQLSIMEATLLDISEIPLDEINMEMINNIFRAMHTMKGNASMFGYDVITDFAHIAENLLDEIRNNRIKITQDILELMLLVKDHSKILIEVFTNNKELNQKQNEHHKFLLKELGRFLKNEEKKEDIVESKTPEIEEAISDLTRYKISIQLKEDFFKSGMDMLPIMRYLDALGIIKNIVFFNNNIPLLDKINPTNAYVKFDIFYDSDENKQEIIEAFEFVQEDIELLVEILNDENILEEKEELDLEEKIESNNYVIEKKEEKKDIDLISEIKTLNTNSLTLKVDSQKIDKLINQISEMVIANAKITQLSINSKNTELEEIVTEMSEMLEEVRDGIMNIRMVQVGDSFAKLRRVVSDTAKNNGKEINFNILGGETELDKTVIEKITDPLIHMLRNSVDHGIESPEERIKKAKDPKGNITLKAYPDSGTIVIEIIDDGKGLDKEIIFNKAVEKGLIDKNKKLTDKDIYNLIFIAGFSTAQTISNISGRGVGMDVVKRNIEELMGHISITSTKDEGTTISIRLPLTLAIINGFLVQSSNVKYIIPLESIKECLELSKERILQLEKYGYISSRSLLLPILDIAEYFDEVENRNKRQNIVVIKYGNHQIGLKVDELYGEFQTVIKPLGDLFANVVGISGGTILGNGEIALILDVQKLIEYKITYKGNEYGN
jgi:two-component system, chemotaxis family, sensor kinase CheA